MSAKSRWLLALRVCLAQVILTVSAAVAWWVGGGSPLGALTGGGAATLISLYFAVRVFSVDAAADPQGFMRRLYRAVAMKLLMTAVFFGLAASYGAEVMGEIVTAFTAVLMGFWVALWPVGSAGRQPPRRQ